MQGYGDTPSECMTKVAALMYTQLDVLGMFIWKLKSGILKGFLDLTKIKAFVTINKIEEESIFVVF